MIYNTKFNPKGVPVDNLWELTLPEWRGRVQMPDPFEGGVQTSVIQTILQNGAALERAHQQQFGSAIKYSPQVEAAAKSVKSLNGKPNAALEWWFRMARNNPVFIGSTDRIFENISSVTQRNEPPIGMVTFSKLRDVKAGTWESRAMFETKPFMGVAYPTVLTIADRAPNPNAAKLLIKYMMEEGLEPWNVLGDYAARADIEQAQMKRFNIPSLEKSGLLLMDSDYVYKNRFDFMRVYTALR